MNELNNDNKIRRKKISGDKVTSQNLDDDLVVTRDKIKPIKRETIDRASSQKGTKATEMIKHENINRESIKRTNDNNENIGRRGSRIKNKKYKKDKLTKKIIKGIMIFVLIGTIFASIAGGAIFFSIAKNAPNISSELLQSKYQSTDVVGKDEIPKYVKDALVAIEDQRFYEHNGVDIKSLFRSLIHNLTSNTTQGASTIQMQISKNLLTTHNQTMKRKLIDMYNALQIDKKLSKDEILAVYLNNMYIGKSSYGISSGAKKYFGVEAKDLNLPQSALLVGITNNPKRYVNHSEAKKRQKVILFKMHQLGYINDKEYKDALKDNTPFISEIG